jgi:hypothetical protein
VVTLVHAAAPVGMDDRLLLLATDFTREGREVSPPAAGKPVYYVPVVMGYQERGMLQGHYERRPPDDVVVRGLVEALAKQGYRMASRDFPPSLTITLEWGTITPVFVGRRVINAAEMRTIIIGSTEFDTVNRYAGHMAEILSLTARHYLIVSAFKYQRTAKTPDVLLWRTHATTDAWGNYLEELAKPLISLAETGFGREVKPGTTWMNGKTGQVQIGELKVIENPKPTRPTGKD